MNRTKSGLAYSVVIDTVTTTLTYVNHINNKFNYIDENGKKHGFDKPIALQFSKPFKENGHNYYVIGYA